ncbi:formate dehydrogenase accessory protein [Vibrio aerogenes CECT 7868]|uniref:Sulfur carrier protein FdhD n=1 Tax=Vibrio aerogenes CECT 7868 TaxID=1216006 RepID=A0A1M5YN80_9VIBR|nr:formate dehydrogenase accessory sulfurtransferase FdhD [Vibrio aerogenes]SHI13400.1 formate dehydrogenase accessory protein [Vibrio aerogenes CECT 7868]
MCRADGKFGTNSASKKQIIRYKQGAFQKNAEDVVVQEVPVALEYNGIAYTVMMCTPIDLEFFAVGFSVTEGIIDHDRDIHNIEIQEDAEGITLSVEIANRCISRLKEKRRSLMGVTGCGICGAEQLNGVRRCVTPVADSTRFDIEKLDPVLIQLNEKQSLNQQTGASHAAAYIDVDGNIQAVFEDVGRHIALDKLIGWILRHHCSQGAVLVTSRASFEMVQKVAVCGIEILLAVSAATHMAIELAERMNITLCGYCRPGKANIYTHGSRITDNHVVNH